MPILGNNNSSDDTLPYGLRRVSAGAGAQEPATHLLINLRTDIELDVSASTSIEDVAQCSGLRYQFSKHHESCETKGTYLLPNKMSSFELWDYAWKGQLVTLGPQVDMRSVETTFGSLYLPDESSFCSSASQKASDNIFL